MKCKWYFTKEELKRSPSAQVGISAIKELEYKQQAAYLIYDMGQRLEVSRSCIYSATIYMHRFYAYHSQARFKKCSVASAALFLATKVSETPKSPEHVIKALHKCLEKKSNQIHVTSKDFKIKISELLIDESILLMTLGFFTNIKHPHPCVLEICQKLRVSKNFIHCAEKMVTYCLQLTSMCLRYKPEDIAIFCVHVTVKRSHFKVEDTIDGKPWFQCLNSKVTRELLRKMNKEFISILDICSPCLKIRLMNLFQKNSESCKSNQNNSSEKLLENEKSVQRPIINHQEYIARRKNQQLVKNNDANSNDNNNNDHDTSKVFMDLSEELVPMSAKVSMTSARDLKTDLVYKNSLKRKRSFDINDISYPAKKLKLS